MSDSGCCQSANCLSVTVKECISSIRRLGYSPKGKIAMTRNYGFVIDDNGKQIFIGDCSKHHLKKLKSFSKIESVAGTFSDEVGLTSHGDIVTSIKNEYSYNSKNTSFISLFEMMDEHQFDDFKDIVSISAGGCHIVGVKRDGTVVCWDSQGGLEGAPDFRNIVKEWQCIKQVAVGYENIIALTNDGRVLGLDESFYTDYNDFIQVDAYGHYYGDCYSMALRSNGRVMSPNFKEVSSWNDIVQIAVGWDVALGLRRDGKVEVTSYGADVTEIVSSWHLVNLECKFSHIIAISEDCRIYCIDIEKARR